MMTPDELVIAALEASSPPKPISDLRRSRFTDGVLLAAAELLLAGDRPEGAEALHTVALARAGISAGHYRSLAEWTRGLIMVAIGHMIQMTAPADAPKRRGRPPKGAATMTNKERQAAFQARLRKAPETIEKIKGVLRLRVSSAERMHMIDRLIMEYERADQESRGEGASRPDWGLSSLFR